MTRIFPALILGLALPVALFAVACGGGGPAEKSGERITDPARVPSSTPIQNPTLYKIQGNEVLISGGPTGQITPVAQATAASSDYVIKAGDFCSTIATANKISVEDLQKANRNADCNNLRIGDHLKIPSAAVPTATKGTLTGNPTARPGTGSKSYTVQPGDTCAAIAAAQGVTLQALLAANSSINSTCSNLNAGVTITIP
ncbi:MAG: LysM peptidoglycan-binding domain-containing protein [bacterium]